jgi:hypothetical protein
VDCFGGISIEFQGWLPMTEHAEADNLDRPY